MEEKKENEKENDEIKKEKNENTENPSQKKEISKEEEINQVLDMLKKAEKSASSRKTITLVFGFFLHPNRVIHLLLTLVINMLISFAIIGYASLINFPLVVFENVGYLILVFLVFTIVEFIIKVFTLRFFPKAAIYSFGLIFFLFYFVTYFFIELLLKSVFHFCGIEEMLIFVFGFAIVRLVFTTYFRKFITKLLLRKRVK